MTPVFLICQCIQLRKMNKDSGVLSIVGDHKALQIYSLYRPQLTLLGLMIQSRHGYHACLVVIQQFLGGDLCLSSSLFEPSSSNNMDLADCVFHQATQRISFSA